jgi:hypothetical protein
LNGTAFWICTVPTCTVPAHSIVSCTCIGCLVVRQYRSRPALCRLRVPHGSPCTTPISGTCCENPSPAAMITYVHASGQVSEKILLYCSVRCVPECPFVWLLRPGGLAVCCASKCATPEFNSLTDYSVRLLPTRLGELDFFFRHKHHQHSHHCSIRCVTQTFLDLNTASIPDPTRSVNLFKTLKRRRKITRC